MKRQLTNVDVAAVAGELAQKLVGGRFEKAFQPAKDMILLRVRRKGLGRMDVLFQLGAFLTITKSPPENPDKPSMVATILRNTLANGRVTGVSQIGFDRLIKMDVERGDGKYGVIFELFGDGNLLLVDEKEEILLPMRGEEHGVRRLKKGEIYVPPPGGHEPLQWSLEQLQEAGANAASDLVRMLAVEVGFGPQWAEELCARAKLEKNCKPQELAGEDWSALHEQFVKLGDELARVDLAPVVVLKGEDAVDAVPFEMQIYAGKPVEEAPSFIEALDILFVGRVEEAEAIEDPRKKKFREARGKIERQIAQMEKALGKFDKQEAASRQKGDALYASFQEVQTILTSLQGAREKMPWADVAQRIKQAREAGDLAAQPILQILPDRAEATLALHDVDGSPVEVAVDLRESVQENADRHYSAAKKAKSRRSGGEKALVDAHKRLKELDAKGLDGFGAAPKKSAGPSKHFWFETYRWTITPSGFLAVGGRNASQNDQVVRKYLRDSDRYVHAQIHGAPSVVVRHVNEPTTPGEMDLRIACQFAACSSRAWRQFGEASAYWVTPAQVNKTPRAGEFVPRGAWIIHGKRNVEAHLKMDWAIGIVEFDNQGAVATEASSKRIVKLVGGPPEGIKPHAKQMILLQPGEVEPNVAAGILARHFECDIEEVQAVLPPGPVALPEGLA